MEGVLLPFGSYSPNKSKVKKFLKALTFFCKKNKIVLYLVSGHHSSVASKKLLKSKLDSFFQKENFFCVSDEYISKKTDADKKLHLDGLAKDPEFVDSYFKQVLIQEKLIEHNLLQKDVLLLSDDVWVDGYYTVKFSNVDFAIFEENVCDRGKKIPKVEGLAYFNLGFSSVEPLLKDFPRVDLSFLDRYVFNEMKKVLVG
jgi:hypothetical protein